MRHTRYARLAMVALAVPAVVALTHARGRLDDEEPLVRRALDHYIQGHATGVGDHFRAAFDPQGRVVSIRDGRLAMMTIDEFVGRAATGKPAADEGRRRRRIESIDITGDAAVAKVVLEYPAVRFTDYMTLLKTGDEWRIINKAFHAEPK
jgi:hypothetical protein